MSILKYKQLSFDTAMRNPERLKDLLEVFYLFNGRTLDDDTLLEIVCTLYIRKLVNSDSVIITEDTTIDEIKDTVIILNSKRNAEGGFPRGVPTRFYNYTKTLCEFGLMYAQYNKGLQFSETVELWLNQTLDAQSVFAIHSMMYNRYSPHRKVANDFNYFKFLIKVLQQKSDHRLSYNDLIISMFCENDNVQNFLDLISQHHFDSDVVLYEWLCDNMGCTNRIGTVLNDYPDIVLRMLRITGFFDVVYHGTLYIKLNTREGLLDQLINVPFQLSDNAKTNALLFFQEINQVLPQYLEIIRERTDQEIQGDVYSNQLSQIVENYDLDQEKISAYLLNMNSSPKEFKYISDPLKLEFYISLLVHLKYGSNYAIKPNYKIDSEGMPISHAPAYKGDIEVTSSNRYWLIEVTLITNKTQQLNNETTSVIRHFQTEKTQYNEKYLSFVAPIVHEDTRNFFKVSFIMLGSNTDSIYGATYSINQFIDTMKHKDIFSDMQEYYETTKEEFRQGLQ